MSHRGWRSSDVEVSCSKCVCFDKGAARFNLVAHQGGKNFVGSYHVVNLHLRSVLPGGSMVVSQSCPDSFRQTLVALDTQPRFTSSSSQSIAALNSLTGWDRSPRFDTCPFFQQAMQHLRRFNSCA